MRALLSRESLPALAYATAALFFIHLAVATFTGDGVPAFATHLLFVPALALLVLSVDAPAWARLAGLGWAALGLLADIAGLGLAAAGAGLGAALFLGHLALLPAAAWIYGASVYDEGAGRALGAATAAGLMFAGALALVRSLILVSGWPLGGILQRLTLVLVVVWFAVLAKDLAAGKRHMGGPVRVTA